MLNGRVRYVLSRVGWHVHVDAATDFIALIILIDVQKLLWVSHEGDVQAIERLLEVDHRERLQGFALRRFGAQQRRCAGIGCLYMLLVT